MVGDIPAASPGPTLYAVLFDTALGPMALAASEQMIVAVQLPELTVAATGRRLLTKVRSAIEVEPANAPEVAVDAVGRIQALLAGDDIDLTPVPVDLSGVGRFNRRVYQEVRALGRGQTCTYGELAARVGEPGAAQAVGRAMGTNPVPVIVPCHRVVGADGKLVGFSANGGIETKRRMLLIEGSPIVAPSLFDEFQWLPQSQPGDDHNRFRDDRS